MNIKSLTIYCSSSNNLDPIYYEISKKITEIIAEFNLSIVYGGGQVGIMGVIARKALELKINVTGIIPEFLNKDSKVRKILRTMNYTDNVIGKFIDKNKLKEWFNNTVFVFISDHGIKNFEELYEDPRNAHIPLIMYGKNIQESITINKIASQVDITPTLLHLIGYPYDYNLMGSNILSNSYNGIACRVVNDYSMWFESNFIYTTILNKLHKRLSYDFCTVLYSRRVYSCATSIRLIVGGLAQASTYDANALAKAGGTMSGTIANFTSTGIDDNAG